MKQKYKKLCPVCRTSNVSLWLGAELGVRYKCNSCNYTGPLVLEELLKKPRKRLKKIHRKR